MSRDSAGKANAAKSRAVHVAAAVAREAVLSLHVQHAFSLIRHGAGRVPELRMLQIYLRLLDLTGPEGEAVATRVLATMGRGHPLTSAEVLSTIPEAGTVSDDGAAAVDLSLLRTLRRRLRGRVHEELRRAVELQIGVAKTALLELHVEHAHNFATLLHSTHEIAEACALYIDVVGVPPAHAPVLYMLVLDRIAARERAAWPAAAKESAEPSAPPADPFAAAM